MKKLILIALLINANVYAQNTHNQLLGKFESNNESTFYKTLSFDNNGKLTIDGFASADYFIVGDTLIVFPDKDLFKFVMKENQLYGVSNWVKDGVWKKTDDQVIDQRTDAKKATEQAALLNEYYQKTRKNINQMEMIFDKNLFKQYQTTLEDLCNKNLLRACKEYFGTLTLEQTGGLESALSNNNTKEVKPNSALEKVIEKVKTLDKNEGFYLEASYLIMIGKTKEGQELMGFVASTGHQEAISQLFNLENKLSTESETAAVSSSKLIKLADLRLFYNTKTEDLKTILKSDYGFKKIDQTDGLDGGTITDFQNELYDKISKFEYQKSHYNRVEYSTVNKDLINAVIDELKKEKYSVVKQGKNTFGNFTDYQKTVTKNGKKRTLYISIIYPRDKKSYEPITIMIF